MVLTLSSPDFPDGGRIPRELTCDGANRSPALRWQGVPPGTACLVLTCDDPDAPRGTFDHWAAWDIPADWTGLAQGAAAEGARLPAGGQRIRQAGIRRPLPAARRPAAPLCLSPERARRADRAA
jgi:Raf kinase inhibitor-like YbhB/YbcL family protein